MVVAILEGVNNHADADFQHLKGICGGHIYLPKWNKTAKDEAHGTKLEKKKVYRPAAVG